MMRRFFVFLLTFFAGTVIGLLLSQHAAGRRDDLIAAAIYAREVAQATEAERAGDLRVAYDAYTRALGALEAHATQDEFSWSLLLPISTLILEPLQVSPHQSEQNRTQLMRAASESRDRLLKRIGNQ